MFETLWLNCILFISFAERSGLRLEMRKQREGKSKGEKDEWTHLSPKCERFASCSVTWGFIFSFLHFFLWRVEQLVKMFSLHNDTCTPRITKEDAAEETVYICILIPWLSFAMQCGMMHILWEVKHHSNYRNDFAVGRFLSVLCYYYTNNSQMHILSNTTVQLLLSTQNALHYKPHSASLFTNSNSKNQTQFTSWARLTGLLFTAVEKDIPKSITQKLSLVCTKQSIVTVARQLTGNL